MKSILFPVLLFSTLHLTAQTESIRIRANIKTGQPGYTGDLPLVMFSNVSDENLWKKTEFEITGFPEDGKEWIRKSIWFQTYQWAYQNYKAGKLDSARFAGLMKNWDFDTLPGKYTAREIASATTMLFRRNENGQIEYYLDTDADRDFSDEKLHLAFPKLMYNQIDSALPYAPVIDYELFLDGKIERGSAPLIVEEYGDFLTYTMPVYAEAVLGNDTLIINSSYPDFHRIKLSEKRDLNPMSIRYDGAKNKEGERVKYSGQWYTIDHFHRVSNELVLQVVDTLKDTISATKGFYAPDFNFKEMISGKKMSLSDLKGKYVLLDFWGTWCTPCVASIPRLVSLTKDLKNKPFEILSIAVASNREDFDKLKEKYGMEWLHSWQPHTDGVVDTYHVNTYPTFVLIDPKGKIVGFDLSHDQVLEILENQN